MYSWNFDAYDRPFRKPDLNRVSLKTINGLLKRLLYFAITGTHMGLGHAQHGQVQWMRDQGIPFYSYTVDQYVELVELATRKERVPEHKRDGRQTRDGVARLAPTPLRTS